jgi:hypothetical protein
LPSRRSVNVFAAQRRNRRRFAQLRAGVLLVHSLESSAGRGTMQAHEELGARSQVCCIDVCARGDRIGLQSRKKTSLVVL